MEEAKTGIAVRRRHDRELKQRVLQECRQPGASVAQVAMNNGLNTNLVHKWRRLAERSESPVAAVSQAPAFIPVALPSSPQPLPDLRIELRRGATTIIVTWPIAAAAECASWMRELLR
ncbi:IS66-like element accessory protein TnpA [Piscinibacter sakaiensis]|uniref:IS66-like element accessory protein TnpA n=1 Tax=Piscinibacter sakaiensis TaxID=1547922 RepID=UPI003AAA304E